MCMHVHACECMCMHVTMHVHVHVRMCVCQRTARWFVSQFKRYCVDAACTGDDNDTPRCRLEDSIHDRISFFLLKRELSKPGVQLLFSQAETDF